jgi:hypothetical protein
MKKLWRITYRSTIEWEAMVVAETEEEAQSLIDGIPDGSWEGGESSQDYPQVSDVFDATYEEERRYAEYCLKKGNPYPISCSKFYDYGYDVEEEEEEG